MSEDGFLARWSRRKREAAAGGTVEEQEASAPAEAPAQPAGPASAASVDPVAPPVLPPVDSLTIESDYAPFMAKEVDPQLKRTALKTLFSDERFNVMDGLDVYIDDYTTPAPIPPEWYGRMAQLAGLGDVPGREAEERARAAAMAQDPDAGRALAPPAPGSAPDSAKLGTDAADIAQPDDCKDVRDEGDTRSR